MYADMHTRQAQAATATDREHRRFRAAGVDSSRLQAAREQLEAAGLTISEWARANDFAASTVYEVLSGRRPCVMGEPLRIAVALALKDAPQAAAPGSEAT